MTEFQSSLRDLLQQIRTCEQIPSENIRESLAAKSELDKRWRELLNTSCNAEDLELLRKAEKLFN